MKNSAIRMITLIAAVIGLSVAIAAQAEVVVTSERAMLRGTPSSSGKAIVEVRRDARFELIKQSDSWFLVQTPDFAGWLPVDAVGPVAKSGASNDLEINLLYGKPPPKVLSPTESTPPTYRPSSGSSGRTYIRGSRGGCYYINSNGRKTYVDRGLCG